MTTNQLSKPRTPRLLLPRTPDACAMSLTGLMLPRHRWTELALGGRRPAGVAFLSAASMHRELRTIARLVMQAGGRQTAQNQRAHATHSHDLWSVGLRENLDQELQLRPRHGVVARSCQTWCNLLQIRACGGRWCCVGAGEGLGACCVLGRQQEWVSALLCHKASNHIKMCWSECVRSRRT